MKKILLTTLLAVIGVGIFAQKLDKAKELYSGKPPKLTEAKTEIDNVLADAKNQKNSEAWYYKAKIYNGIANDSMLAAKNPDVRWQAFEAIKKYTETDDKKEILLQLDQYKPVLDIYQNYYKTGATQFAENKYEAAYNNFKNCLAVSDFMSAKGWTTIKLDTTVILYTGICAEKAGKKDDAAIYYSRLADAKVRGEGMVEIYKWLADYYSKKKDNTNAGKYLAAGKELFPKDPFWNIYELDMLREQGDKKDLFTKYESVIAENPSDYLVLYNYSVELYGAAYDTSMAKRPANSAELITKVEANMKKVTELKPDYANAYLVLGQVAYNKGVDINTEMNKIRPAGGVKLKPEELKKKNDLRAEAGKRFDEAIPYFEKIDQILGVQGKLHMEDKKALKTAYDLLINIYDTKNNKDKLKVYEEKYNNVEKSHS
jgi:hypothetical protein